MKKLITSILISHLFLVFSFGQAHRIKVEMMSGRNLKGWLVAVDSGSITITKGWSESMKYSPENAWKISVCDISEIKIKGKTKIGKGALTGLGIGFTSGIFIGFITEAVFDGICFTPPCESQIAERMTLGFTLTGVGVGILIGGNVRKTNLKFTINGSSEALKLYSGALKLIAI